jgi:hypothetical protein
MKVAGEQNLYQQIHKSYGKTALSSNLVAVQQACNLVNLQPVAFGGNKSGYPY